MRARPILFAMVLGCGATPAVVDAPGTQTPASKPLAAPAAPPNDPPTALPPLARDATLPEGWLRRWGGGALVGDGASAIGYRGGDLVTLAISPLRDTTITLRTTTGDVTEITGEGYLYPVAWAPGLERIAAGKDDVTVWDAGGTKKASREGLAGPYAFAGRWLVGTAGGSLSAWDPESGATRSFARLSGHVHEIAGAREAPVVAALEVRGSKAAGTAEMQLWIVDVESGKQRSVDFGAGRREAGVAVDPDGAFALVVREQVVHRVELDSQDPPRSHRPLRRLPRALALRHRRWRRLVLGQQPRRSAGARRRRAARCSHRDRGHRRDLDRRGGAGRLRARGRGPSDLLGAHRREGTRPLGRRGPAPARDERAGWIPGRGAGDEQNRLVRDRARSSGGLHVEPRQGRLAPARRRPRRCPAGGARQRHACGVDGAGKVWCWGANDRGQLGAGEATPDGPAHAVAVQEVDEAIAIAAGDDHTCALRRGGTVACWGAGRYGQLGDGTQADRPRAVEVPKVADASAVIAGGAASCAITRGGKVACWGRMQGLGRAFLSEPVVLPGLAEVATVATTGERTCAVDARGRIDCWGNLE